MRLPKFISRTRQRLAEAELIPGASRRRHALRPIHDAAIEDAPEWTDGAGLRAMEEIRDLHGPLPRRNRNRP